MTLAERLQQPDVSGLSESAAAAFLNVPDVANGTRRRSVPTSEARALLLATGEWGAIKLLSRTTPTTPEMQQAVAVAITTIDTMTETTLLEANRADAYAAMQTMVGVLQAANVLTAQTAAALLALADVPMSWAEANGYPNGVDPRAVSLARGAKP